MGELERTVIKCGSTVYVYEPPCKPSKGIVSEITEYGIRVTIDRKLCPDKVHIRSRVFLWPEQKKELISTLIDDANDLERYAKELSRI